MKQIKIWWRSPIFYFCLIVLIGLVIRLYQISPPLLERSPNREAIDAEIVRGLYRRGFNHLDMFLFGIPLYHWLVAAMYAVIGGINEVAGRVVSVVFSVIAAYFFYKLVNMALSKRLALLSLFFFYVLSPIHIIVSRSFLVDELTLALGIAAVYFLILWKIKRMESGFWLSGLMTAVMLLSKITFGYLLLPLSGVIFYQRGHKYKIDIKRWTVYMFLALLPAVMWYGWAKVANLRFSAIEPHGGWDVFWWFSPNELWSWQFYSNVFFHFMKWVTTPIGMILVVMGLQLKKSWSGYIWFYVWFLAAVLFILIFNRASKTHAYYFLAFCAPAAVFAARTVDWLISMLKMKTIMPVILVIILLTMVTILSLVNDNFLSAYRVYPAYAQMPLAAKIVQKVVPSQSPIISTAYTAGIFGYFADRLNSDLRLSDLDDRGAIEFLEAQRQRGFEYYVVYDKKELAGKDVFVKYLQRYPIVAEPNDLNLRIYKL